MLLSMPSIPDACRPEPQLLLAEDGGTLLDYRSDRHNVQVPGVVQDDEGVGR